MVVAERKLVEVGRQVLPRNGVVSPVQGAFKLAPKALNGIGMEHSTDILPFPVIDSPMLEARGSDLVVARKFVRGDRGPFFDAGLNHRHQGFALNVWHHGSPNVAAALCYSENGGLSRCSAPALPLALASDIGFVGLHDATQNLSVALHEKSYLLGDPPGALVGDAQLPLKFFGRDSVLGLAHEEYGVKPKSQRCRALMEDCAFRRVDLVTAGASVRAAAHNGVKLFLLALGALKALGVAFVEDVGQTAFVVGEVFLEVRDRVFLFHALSLTDNLLVVKG